MVWDIPQSQAALYIKLSLQSIFSKAFGLAGAIMSVLGGFDLLFKSRESSFCFKKLPELLL